MEVVIVIFEVIVCLNFSVLISNIDVDWYNPDKQKILGGGGP